MSSGGAVPWGGGGGLGVFEKKILVSLANPTGLPYMEDRPRLVGKRRKFSDPARETGGESMTGTIERKTCVVRITNLRVIEC